jgi:hypothetical protein
VRCPTWRGAGAGAEDGGEAVATSTEQKALRRMRAEGREGEEASAIRVRERDWSGVVGADGTWMDRGIGVSGHHGPTCRRLPSVLAGSHGERRAATPKIVARNNCLPFFIFFSCR